MFCNKRRLTAIVAAALALSLLLTACGTGDTPTGGNTTPVTASTPTETPDVPETAAATTEPDNTPAATPKATEPPLYEKPTWPTAYDNERKAIEFEEAAHRAEGYGLHSLDDVIDNAYTKYGQYMHDYLTQDVLSDACKLIINQVWATSAADNGNLTGVSAAALNKVNAFLTANGEETLTDMQDPTQAVYALWLAINLNYYAGVSPYVSKGYIISGTEHYWDLAMAVGLSTSSNADPITSQDAEVIQNMFFPGYEKLYGLVFDDE